MEKIHDIKNFLKSVFTKSLLKKLAAVVVVAAFCAGGGAYYLHQQKQERKIMVAQAQTAVIENLAKEKNISLIDDSKVRALVAKSIGVDENAIVYKEISLKDTDKKNKHEKNLPLADNTGDKVQRSETFQPIYKVSCMANNVKYKIRVDAVTGDIVNIKVG